MTERDTTPDDERDQPEAVGGFQFGVTDGGEDGDERPPTRADGAGAGRSAGFDFQEWLGSSLSDLREKPSRSEETEPVDTTAADSISFAGFDFGAWLDATEAEAVAPETAEAESEPDLGPTYSGFDFRQWMADDGETGPKEPPETPRVVGATPEPDVSTRARLLGLLPFFSGPKTADTYPGGFEFAEWLSEGEGTAEVIAPLEPEPDPEPAPAETATIEGSGYPTPPGGGLADSPPIKVAALALFAASLVAVGLTLTGAIGAIGPASGFSDPPAVNDTDEQPVATATPTPEPTATPTGEPTPTPTPEPTATPTPMPEPTATPTPTPEPTATPTPEPTATPTPTPENDSVFDPVTDPIFG
jgi:hypothetical protein